MTNVGGTGPTYVKGHVINVETFTDNQNRSTTNTAWTDSGISVSYTPKYATSTLYVYAHFLAYIINNNGITQVLAEFNISDDANSPLSGAEYGRIGYYDAQLATGREHYAPVVMLGVAPAGSASARNYKIRYKTIANQAVNIKGADVVTRIVIKEVAA
jgi:hypothetical protein